MSEWAEGVITANRLEIAYHRTGSGSGKPPLVLLHGYTDNGLCWSPLARDLEKTFDVIMPDARGHGHTRGPVDDMRIDLLAEDAAAFIREMRLEKPFIFGHSMGAMTALALAANYPDRVRAAVLEDPPFKATFPFVPPPEEAEMLQRDAQEGLAFQLLPLEEREAVCRRDNPNWPEGEVTPWAASKGEYKPEIVPLRIAFRSYNWREAIAEAQCPLLLVTGSVEQGALVPPELAAEAVQINERCEVGFVEGAGHSIHRDRPAETLQRVTDFLAHVP